MSFRLYVYYCALCGGGAAFLGWMLGRPIRGGEIAGAGLKALFLGAAVASALAIIDLLWNVSLRRGAIVTLRIGTALMGGALGGLIGGIVSQSLYRQSPWALFLVLGWTFTGLLIGAALGGFDLLNCLLHGLDAGGALRKIRNGILGGTLGGFLGGLLSVFLRAAWNQFFQSRDDERLWSPSAWGFVALGLCIGLFIGLAQVLLKEAWLYVEQGFRKGREMMLDQPEMTIGRAESCDLGLFGDNGVERLHARILRRGGRFLLENVGDGKTLVNGLPIAGTHALESGDEIQLGRSRLRFRERVKRRVD
jgi:hypothetical protein